MARTIIYTWHLNNGENIEFTHISETEADFSRVMKIMWDFPEEFTINEITSDNPHDAFIVK